MNWITTNLEPEGISASPALLSLGDLRLLLGECEGRVWAIEDRCTHADCAFSTDGEIDGHVAVCDCHGSEFDVFTGAVLAPPADEQLRTFPTRTVGGRIEVQV